MEYSAAQTDSGGKELPMQIQIALVHKQLSVLKRHRCHIGNSIRWQWQLTVGCLCEGGTPVRHASGRHPTPYKALVQWLNAHHRCLARSEWDRLQDTIGLPPLPLPQPPAQSAGLPGRK